MNECHLALSFLGTSICGSNIYVYRIWWIIYVCFLWLQYLCTVNGSMFCIYIMRWCLYVQYIVEWFIFTVYSTIIPLRHYSIDVNTVVHGRDFAFVTGGGVRGRGYTSWTSICTSSLWNNLLALLQKHAGSPAQSVNLISVNGAGETEWVRLLRQLLYTEVWSLSYIFL